MYWVKDRHSTDTDIINLADKLWRLSLPADWNTAMQHDVIEFAERFIDSLLASANESDM
jgi:hypothetical protein